MKLRLFHSIVTTLIVLFSATLYLTSCQKDNVNTESQSQSTSITPTSAVDREDSACPNCMGKLFLYANNLTPGYTCSFKATIQKRECSWSSWTTVSNYTVNPYTVTVVLPFEISQDYYYRITLKNTGNQAPLFSSLIQNPGSNNTTNTLVANLGVIAPGQSATADFFQLNTGQIGKGNCGCVPSFSCE